MKREFARTARLAVALCFAVATVASAATPAAVTDVQNRWASALYETPKAERVAALEAVVAQAEKVREAESTEASAWIWEGIVLSSLAGEKGGLGALSLVKRARADFEKAISIEPGALSGAAYTSLGALYYQVPGWPIGFGDDDKARELLFKGLELNPDGIDSNYFVGDFLRDRKDWPAAAAAFEKALAASPRQGREVADEGRRNEIRGKLEEVRARLAKG